MRKSFLLPLLAACALPASMTFGASLLNITSTGTAISEVDLTATGTTNWALWDIFSSSTVSDLAPTASKNTGSATGIGIMSHITPFGGTTVRGTTSINNYTDTFTWTQSDEASNIAAPSDGLAIGAFNGTLNTTGLGVTFNITDLAALSGGLYYEISVFTTSFRGTGEFNADINGTSTVTQAGIAHDTIKDTDYFSIAYNPDSTSDVLNISFELASLISGGSAHTAIQAVSISIVPEPSTFALIAGCLAMVWIGLQRRRLGEN
ncbi:hypothetical protein [Coraliomargarita parva]|uniref:hypothetical protein n=1 Tax=Coraliomargarita parva TaxID=3014050 RepID=UPI0022B4ACDB|nr:hypothetical protein [Coraliomargarita parva]